MQSGGVKGKRTRRYRAAVYAQCASAREVDSAFDALTEMMLSDRREDYLWCALLDHTPSALFRTFGDYEIEERIRLRFERLCEDYPECGFLCLLRGRRYCGFGEKGRRKRGDGNVRFRCEGGIYGAVRTLVSGRSEGCSLRVCTGDSVEHSERLFIRDLRDGEYRLFPCDITRSSLIDGAVAVTDRDSAFIGAKRRFIRALDEDFSGNYRAVGWITFPFEASAGVGRYPVYRASDSGKVRRGSCRGVNSEKAFVYAMRDFLPDITGGSRALSVSTDTEKLSGTHLASALMAYVALGDAKALDAVNLQDSLRILIEMIGKRLCGYGDSEELSAELGDAHSCRENSDGFLRIALLIAAAYCDGLGEYGEGFFSLADKMRFYAEKLRLEYELGEREVVAPFLPCEMLAFRICGDGQARFFGGFTASKRLCDCFLYPLAGERRSLCFLLSELLLGGFGEHGALNGSCCCSVRNALILCISSQLRFETFSRLIARIPELRACPSLLRSLSYGY